MRRFWQSPTKAAPQTLIGPPTGTTTPGGAGLALTIGADPSNGPGGVATKAPGFSVTRLINTSFLNSAKGGVQKVQASAPVVVKTRSRISY